MEAYLLSIADEYLAKGDLEMARQYIHQANNLTEDQPEETLPSLAWVLANY